MKAFFLFPGQGAQYPGMAIDLLAAGKEVKSLFNMASDIMGKDMADLLANSEPEFLKRTDISQPAITLANLAAAAYLEEKGIQPCGCAGFSLGEYAALATAGVISLEDCFFLINQRGLAMQAAIDNIQARSKTNASANEANDPADAESTAPGMAAIIGLPPEQVENLIIEWKKKGLNDLYAANLNSLKQVVVSGSAAALKEAEKLFREAGAKRCIRLQVAGPFHSALMKEAADAFAPFLEKIKFNDPTIPVFSNVTGKQINSGEEAKTLALRQIVESVRWTDEEAAIAGQKPEMLLEAGPGRVLQGLWKDTGNEIPCSAAGAVDDIEQLAKLC